MANASVSRFQILTVTMETGVRAALTKVLTIRSIVTMVAVTLVTCQLV